MHTPSRESLAAESPRVSPDLVGEARREHETRLTGYARRILHDIARARDVVQETFLALARQPAEPDLRPRLAPWLFTVCRRKALSEIRRDSRHASLEHAPEPVDAAADDPARALVRGEDHRRLLALVDGLPPAQREVVRLRFQEDFSYEEIADVTERSASHVGVLLHQAMQTLRCDWRGRSDA